MWRGVPATAPPFWMMGGSWWPADIMTSLGGFLGTVVRPSTGSVILTGSMNCPRTAHSAVKLHNGKVLMISGGWTNARVTKTAEVYNPPKRPVQAGRRHEGGRR